MSRVFNPAFSADVNLHYGNQARAVVERMHTLLKVRDCTLEYIPGDREFVVHGQLPIQAVASVLSDIHSQTGTDQAFPWVPQVMQYKIAGQPVRIMLRENFIGTHPVPVKLDLDLIGRQEGLGALRTVEAMIILLDKCACTLTYNEATRQFSVIGSCNSEILARLFEQHFYSKRSSDDFFDPLPQLLWLNNDDGYPLVILKASRHDQVVQLASPRSSPPTLNSKCTLL